MKLKKLTAGLLLFGLLLPVLAWAGAVEDYSLPHLVTITVPKHTNNPSVYFSQRDSISFTLESPPKANPVATTYDTSCVTDTLTAISLENVVPYHFATAAGTAAIDSVWVGRLTLEFTSPLGATDTVFSAIDISPSGGTYQAGSFPYVQIGYCANCGVGSNGPLHVRAGATQDGSCVVYVDVVSSNPGALASLLAPPSTTLHTGTLFAAEALRFRLNIGTSSALKSVKRATWTCYSSSPDRNR